MDLARHRFIVYSVLWVFLALWAQGCLEPIKVERQETKRGSFGEEVYNILYDNTVRSPDNALERARVFSEYRTTFITAVDDALPPSELEPVNQAFKDIVPLYESKLYQALLRKIAVVLDELRQSPQTLQAYAYIDAKPSYIAHPENGYFLAHVFNYSKFGALSQTMLELLLKNSDGPYNPTNQLIKALSLEFASLKHGDPDPLLYTVLDRFLDEDPDFAPPGPWQPNDVVKVDRRGAPKINPFEGDVVFLPFIDENGDTLADVDEFSYFKLSNQGTISPFEPKAQENAYFQINNMGRITKRGHEVFQYFDIHQTPLAYLIREGDTLLEDKTLDDALRAMHTLLSYKVKYTDEHGEYIAFTDTSPLYQLLHGLLQITDNDEIGPNLETLIILLKNYPDNIAAMLHDLDLIIDIIDELDPDIKLNNNLIDELLPLFLEMSQTPGLLEDVMLALNEPLSRKMAPALTKLARIRKDFIEVDPNGAYEACFSHCKESFSIGTLERYECIQTCPVDEVIGTQLVDRTRAESASNRSLFQRVMALMWETSEASYDAGVVSLIAKGNDITPLVAGIGPLMNLQNLAMLYLHTFTGDMHLMNHINPRIVELAEPMGINDKSVAGVFSWVVAQVFKIQLSISPTTDEVTRFFNLKELKSQNANYTFTINVARCNSKRKCIDANSDTLFAIEAVGLVDAMHPIVAVFNKHKKTALFPKIAALIYTHYPSKDFVDRYEDGTALPLQADNYRAVEPLLIEILDRTTIIESVGDFFNRFVNITLSDNTKILTRLSKFVTFLLTPDPLLKNALGQNITYDPTQKEISPISPAYLIIDPLRDIVDMWDKEPALKKQIRSALGGFASVTIKTQKMENGDVRFEKPAGIKIIATLLQIVWEQYVEKTQNGTRHAWLYEEAMVTLKDMMTGRLVYAFFELLAELDKDPEALANVREFALYAMQSGENAPEHLTLFLYNLISLLYEPQKLVDLAHFIAPPIDPERVWHTEGYTHLSFLLTVIKCVNAFNRTDPDGVYNRFFYRLFNTKTNKQANVVRLLNVAKAMLRTHPGTHERMSAEDQKKFFDFAYAFFVDTDRGIERIYKVIEFTVWGTAGRPADWVEPP